MKFGIGVFVDNLSRKFRLHLNLTRITGILYVDQCTFLIISRSVLRRLKNVSDESCWETRNTHFMFSNLFFENRAVYEIMWKNIVEPDRPQITIQCIYISCLIR